jgi:hypothetical protein
MKWLRALCVLGLLCLWHALSMRGASPNTSWEHHAYAGPFILLKNTYSPIDFLLSVPVALSILLPAAQWIRKGSVWLFLVAVLAAGFSIMISYFFAYSASV